MADILPFPDPKNRAGEQGRPQTLEQEVREFDFAQRALAADMDTVTAQESNLKKPGKIAYFILFYISVVADIVSFLEKFVEVTGVGLLIVFLLNLAFSIFFFIFNWHLGRKIKHMRLGRENLEKITERTLQRATKYRRMLAFVLKRLRRYRAGRQFLKSKLGRKFVSGTRVVAKSTRSPVLRTAFAAIAELVPILDLVPWYTLGTYLTYRDHKREYENSKITLAETYPALEEEAEQILTLRDAVVRDQVAQEEAA